MALNALLNISSVVVVARYMTAKTGLRLRESRYLDDFEPGHSEILTYFDFILSRELSARVTFNRL